MVLEAFIRVLSGAKLTVLTLALVLGVAVPWFSLFYRFTPPFSLFFLSSGNQASSEGGHQADEGAGAPVL